MTKTSSLAFSVNKEPAIKKHLTNQLDQYDNQAYSNEIDVKTYKIMEENSQDGKTND